jgi:fructosamine-3-kinase
MDLTQDSSLLSALGILPSSKVTAHSHGGSSFSSTWRLTSTTPDGHTSDYFVKTGTGQEAEVMFHGEHASLNAIADAVPSFCPRSHAHGPLSTVPGKFFLATDFLDLSGSGTAGSGETLAQKLARLHTTPAPTPDGEDRAMFGFPVPTCCGNTVQDNSFRESWAEFFADNRLRSILRAAVARNGANGELSETVERVASEVVPRLLGDGHPKVVKPVVVHGDLWSGNHGRGRIAGRGGVEEVVYDPSCVYGHSEYELGIMRMFGGYGGAFWKEYDELVPKSEPVDEWEDRIALYELCV